MANKRAVRDGWRDGTREVESTDELAAFMLLVMNAMPQNNCTNPDIELYKAIKDVELRGKIKALSDAIATLCNELYLLIPDE